MSMADNQMIQADQDRADDKSAGQAALHEDVVAQQPLSGQRVVRTAAFGSGASAATPDYVCTVKIRR